ncbi:hypothetical protein NFI96_017395, partial [Prochilodus magdalenae]
MKWCQRNFLQINAGKTKELVVDFRRATHFPPERPEQTTPPEETQVFWSAGGAPEDLLRCCGGNIHLLWSGLHRFTADWKRLNRVIKKSSSVLGCPLDPVEVVGDRRMRTKFKHMLKNLSHPMYHSLEAMGSSLSARLLHPRCVKKKYRRSFHPAAVR